MIRLAANLSMLFTEEPFPARFAAAAGAGFRAVEYLFPYEWPAEQIRDRLAQQGLTQVVFNLPAGDWAAGERGIAALPGRTEEFRSGLTVAVRYARVLGCHKLHMMSGTLPPRAERKRHLATFLENMKFAADALAEAGIELLIEPINSRVDIPGYLIDRPDLAVELIEQASRSNIKLQFDVYHMQIMQGDLARSIERLLPYIGHIQIAGNPGRHEPNVGEVNYEWLLGRIEQLGYEGWIGCEYKPRSRTVDGLAWAQRYLTRVEDSRG